MKRRAPCPETRRRNPQTAVSPGNVSFVEDMEINREIVLALLEPTCAEVDGAENSAEAVRMFSEAPGKYDLIFMDVQMPVMDGYEAPVKSGPSMPQRREDTDIAMTANVFKDDIERCLDVGMNSHVENLSISMKL
jgi:CheY-like chemotaxis protein